MSVSQKRRRRGLLLAVAVLVMGASGVGLYAFRQTQLDARALTSRDLGREAFATPSHDPRRDDEERDRGERQQRERHRQDQHRDDRRDERDGVGEDVRERRRHGGLDATDVGGDAALQIAGSRRRIERQAQLLQV